MFNEGSSSVLTIHPIDTRIKATTYCWKSLPFNVLQNHSQAYNVAPRDRASLTLSVLSISWNIVYVAGKGLMGFFMYNQC